MKKIDSMRVYAWIEFAIWLIVIAACVFTIRYHNYQHQKQFKSYQIFMNDVDGLIVGSPVKFLGVRIGHVTKIQLVSTDTSADIYIKFIITEKDLELPLGSVATVEGSGLGGSKALEVYPPKDEYSKNKIIGTKDSTRLGKVLSLFNEIFKDIDDIITTIGHASEELSSEKAAVQKNVITPADADAKIINLNKQLDGYIEQDKKIKKFIRKNQQKPDDDSAKGEGN